MTEPPTGRQEAFSPTDLIAAALGACILTAVGAAAEANDYVLPSARIAVEKRMYEGPRRIGELAVAVHLPKGLSAPERKALENVAKACPVRYSLHAAIALSFEFNYDLESGDCVQLPAAMPLLPPASERKETRREAAFPAGNMVGPARPEWQEHWEHIYTTKGESQVSWYQDDPARSLHLILEFAKPGSYVIDIGGGSSVLAGRLVERRFTCAVLDISETALNYAKARVGASAAQIQWIISDVMAAPDLGKVDLWHDRAVFHFLTNSDDRKRYVALAERTLPVGGHLLIGTFAPDGPDRCSELPVRRYDAHQLAVELGPGFALRRELRETHTTPWGSTQPFTYAVFERVATGSSTTHSNVQTAFR